MRSCHSLRDRCRIRWHFLSAGHQQRVASEDDSSSSFYHSEQQQQQKRQHTWLFNIFGGSSTCVRMSYKGWNDFTWTRLVFFLYFIFFKPILCFIKVQIHLKQCEHFLAILFLLLVLLLHIFAIFWLYLSYSAHVFNIFMTLNDEGVFCAAVIIVILLNFYFFLSGNCCPGFM